MSTMDTKSDAATSALQVGPVLWSITFSDDAYVSNASGDSSRLRGWGTRPSGARAGMM